MTTNNSKARTKDDKNIVVSLLILTFSWLLMTLIGPDAVRILGLSLTPLLVANLIIYFERCSKHCKGGKSHLDQLQTSLYDLLPDRGNEKNKK